MSNMFDNYKYIPSDYSPKNTNNKITPCKPKIPMVEYDALDNFIGFSWRYGDSVSLQFTTTGDVSYEEDGQEYYEDAETYLSGKTVQLIIYDFRYDVVYNKEEDASTLIEFTIDKKDSDKFVKGNYTCELILKDDESEYTLFDNSDCKFIVK